MKDEIYGLHFIPLIGFDEAERAGFVHSNELHVQAGELLECQLVQASSFGPIYGQ